MATGSTGNHVHSAQREMARPNGIWQFAATELRYDAARLSSLIASRDRSRVDVPRARLAISSIASVS